MRRVRPGHVLGYTVKPGSFMARWRRGWRVCPGALRWSELGYAFRQQGQGGALQALVHSGCMHWRWRGCTLCFSEPERRALFRQRALVAPGARTCVVNGSGVDVGASSVKRALRARAAVLFADRAPAGRQGCARICAGRTARAGAAPRCALPAGGLDQHQPRRHLRSTSSMPGCKGALEFWGTAGRAPRHCAMQRVCAAQLPRRARPHRAGGHGHGYAVITTDAPGCRETVVQSG